MEETSTNEVPDRNIDIDMSTNYLQTTPLYNVCRVGSNANRKFDSRIDNATRSL